MHLFGFVWKRSRDIILYEGIVQLVLHPDCHAFFHLPEAKHIGQKMCRWRRTNACPTEPPILFDPTRHKDAQELGYERLSAMISMA